MTKTITVGVDALWPIRWQTSTHALVSRSPCALAFRENRRPGTVDFVWPNGLAFSPDFSKLYLAVSSPDDPAWYVYDVGEDGGLANRRLFLDARPLKEVRTRQRTTLTTTCRLRQRQSEDMAREHAGGFIFQVVKDETIRQRRNLIRVSSE